MKISLRLLPFILLIQVLFINDLVAKVLFMHPAKTAGTSLRLLLEQQLSTSEIYPFRNTNSANRPFKELLISGHFPYWFSKNLDDDFENTFKITILREPIERYISFLRYKKKVDSELIDLEAIFQLRLDSKGKYYGGLIDNYLCRFLSDDPFLNGEALLENAKKNLEQFDCVIFFDHYTEDVIDLFRRFDINLKRDDIPKVNVGFAEPVELQLLEEIKKHNELDMQLYAFAKEHLCQKNNTYPLRTSTFDNLLESTSFVDYTFDLPLWGRGWTFRDEFSPQSIRTPSSRWVTDHPATVWFSLEEGFDYSLFFSAKLLTQDIIPKVIVNGNEIKYKKLNSDHFSIYEGVIQKEWITQSPTEIEFSSNKAYNYSKIYPERYDRNLPLLSFALNRILICSAN